MVIDIKTLIERMEGDRELCEELVDIFIEDLPERVFSIKRALDENNNREVEEQAHSIKGAALNLCADEISHTAGRIEIAGRDNDLSLAKSLIGNIEAAFEKIKTECGQYWT